MILKDAGYSDAVSIQSLSNNIKIVYNLNKAKHWWIRGNNGGGEITFTSPTLMDRDYLLILSELCKDKKKWQVGEVLVSFTTDEQNRCKKTLLLSVKKPTK